LLQVRNTNGNWMSYRSALFGIRLCALHDQRADAVGPIKLFSLVTLFDQLDSSRILEAQYEKTKTHTTQLECRETKQSSVREKHCPNELPTLLATEEVGIDAEADGCHCRLHWRFQNGGLHLNDVFRRTPTMASSGQLHHSTSLRARLKASWLNTIILHDEYEDSSPPNVCAFPPQVLTIAISLTKDIVRSTSRGSTVRCRFLLKSGNRPATLMKGNEFFLAMQPVQNSRHLDRSLGLLCWISPCIVLNREQIELYVEGFCLVASSRTHHHRHGNAPCSPPPPRTQTALQCYACERAVQMKVDR
jgi:hypothetical protein